MYQVKAFVLMEKSQSQDIRQSRRCHQRCVGGLTQQGELSLQCLQDYVSFLTFIVFQFLIWSVISGEIQASHRSQLRFIFMGQSFDFLRDCDSEPEGGGGGRCNVCVTYIGTRGRFSAFPWFCLLYRSSHIYTSVTYSCLL